MHMQIYAHMWASCILVAMRGILARADGQDAELRPIGARLGRAHLGVVKHPVALLREERHVHREALRRAVTLVPQRLLRLHEVLHAQQRACQEISRSLAGSQDRSAEGVDAVNEAVVVVAHRVARQETGVAQ